MTSGEENSLQGDFGETWIEVVAAGCDYLHARPASLDHIKADVQVTHRGEVAGTWYPAVQIQVKTIGKLRRVGDHFAYDLDVETYDVLRRTNNAVPRILAVIEVGRSGERVKLMSGHGTLLAGVGAWASLSGSPPSGNGSTVAVRLPVANTLDQAGFDRMIRDHAVRRRRPNSGAAVDFWEEA